MGTELADEMGGVGYAAVNLSGLGGDDVLRALNPIPPFDYYGFALSQYASVFDGGDGNDSIFGGDGTDTIAGGAGDDLIYGGIRTFDQYHELARLLGLRGDRRAGFHRPVLPAGAARRRTSTSSMRGQATTMSSAAGAPT